MQSLSFWPTSPGRVILSLPWRCLDPFPPLGRTRRSRCFSWSPPLRAVRHGPALRAFLRRSLISCWLRTFFPAQCMARNSSATAHAVSRSWTWLKDVGGDIFSVGPQGLRAPQFCMSLPCQTASALQRADPCPFTAVFTPLSSGGRSPIPASVFALSTYPRHLGPLVSFPSTSSRGRLSRLSRRWGGVVLHLSSVNGCIVWFFLFWTAHGSSVSPAPLPSSRASASLLVLSAHMLWISPSTIPTLTLDLFDGGGLHGTVMIPAQVDAQLGIEEEKLHVFFVPEHSATSLTALRAVQLSQMFVRSGAQQYTLPPAEVSTSAQHCWVFDPTHPANTYSAVRAHVRFVGQVCAPSF